jgi:hypothetical protein
MPETTIAPGGQVSTTVIRKAPEQPEPAPSQDGESAALTP